MICTIHSHIGHIFEITQEANDTVVLPSSDRTAAVQQGIWVRALQYTEYSKALGPGHCRHIYKLYDSKQVSAAGAVIVISK